VSGDGLDVAEQRLPAASTLALAVLGGGQARWLNDLGAMPGIATPRPAAGSIRAVLSAPLRSEGRTIGVLEAYGGERAAFGPEEAGLLSAFADATSIALDKTRAHEEIQRLLDAVQAREVELTAQNDELVAQAEQIQAQNEELASREAEFARLYESSQRQAAQMRAIIDATGDAIMVVDAHQHVSAVNPAFESLTGYTAADLTGHPCQFLLQAAKEDGQFLCASTCPFLHEKGDVLPAVDATVMTRDGRQVWVNVVYGPIYDVNGRPAAVVHAIRDISARRELERQKDEFLSTVAHDLKSPLTSIKGFAQLLRRRVAQRGGARDETQGLEVIENQTDRVADMVNHLLDLTRIQMGRLEIRHEPVALTQLAQRVVAQLQITTSGHELSVEAGKDDEVVGLWDAGYVERVLRNLVDNAVKYSPEGGKVTVLVQRTGGEALVAVRDEGIGIDKESLGKVFERYFRSPDARRGPQGLGLGLYVTKSLVEAHGGRIWVESALGWGSTFYFTLPLDRTSPQEHDSPTPPRSG
jgi:PAS domain S-box-containing protein